MLWASSAEGEATLCPACASLSSTTTSQRASQINSSLGAFWLLQSINSMFLLLWGHEVVCFRSARGLGEVCGHAQGHTKSRRCSTLVVELLPGNHQEATEESLFSKCLGILDCDDLFCIYSELWPRIWGFVKWECELQRSLGLLWLTTEAQLCRTSRNILVQSPVCDKYWNYTI